jgi:hypothetical protein
VAVTRAKALLIVIGNPNLLEYDPNWRTLLHHIYLNGGYTGCNYTPKHRKPPLQAGDQSDIREESDEAIKILELKNEQNDCQEVLDETINTMEKFHAKSLQNDPLDLLEKDTVKSENLQVTHSAVVDNGQVLPEQKNDFVKNVESKFATDMSIDELIEGIKNLSLHS